MTRAAQVNSWAWFCFTRVSGVRRAGVCIEFDVRRAPYICTELLNIKAQSCSHHCGHCVIGGLRLGC